MKKHSIIRLLTFSFLLLVFTEISTAQPAQVTVNADDRIVELLMLKKAMEKENRLSGGYTIQLYYGELSGANREINKYRSSYSAWPASIEYETPNYKVWVGNFTARLEADRALVEVKKRFPAAFILKSVKK
ncbi:MAG: SPOR domain-containing protein [Marinirhabdus sp.]